MAGPAAVVATLWLAATAFAFAGATGPARLYGTWTTSDSKAQFLAAHPDPSEIGPENWGKWKLVLKPGHFVQTKLDEPSKGSVTAGKFIVSGTRLTLEPDAADVWIYAWKLSTDGKTLTLKKLKHDEPTGFVATPWKHVG